MHIKLNALKIENFKGVKSLTVSFPGNTNIYGDNGTGKTTLYDAWLWLLFDKDSQNKKDFEIKPLKENGEPVHNVETTVEAEITADDKAYTFAKTFKEKWIKKRGQSQQEFAGHTVNYYINGVPKKKSEYTTAINNIIKEDIFKILSSVTFFNEQINWKDRRNTLLYISGLHEDDIEFAKSSPEFSVLEEVFETYTADDYKKMLLSTRKKLNDEIKNIPVRIDELLKSTENGKTDIDITSLENSINLLKKQRADLFMQPSDIKNPYEDKIKRLRKLVAEKEFEKDKRIRELKTAQEDPFILKNKLKGNEIAINNIDKKINELRQKWFEESKKTAEINDKCPCCGQTLPTDKVQASIEQFNLQKAERLKNITQEGQQLSEQLANIQKEQEDLQKKIDAAENTQKQIDEIKTEFNAVIEQFEKEIESLMQQTNKPQDNSKKQEQISALTAQIEELEEQIAAAKAARNTKKRITELEAKEKELASLFAENEDKINLVEKFISAKVSVIENSINSKFEIARFKMFNTQINGGIEETCETTVNGVPYRNLNNGMRINVGLDIIRTLQKHYETNIPIFIDNAESITSTIDMGDTQIIKLIVSGKDKKIKVEEAE